MGAAGDMELHRLLFFVCYLSPFRSSQVAHPEIIEINSCVFVCLHRSLQLFPGKCQTDDYFSVFHSFVQLLLFAEANINKQEIIYRIKSGSRLHI